MSRLSSAIAGLLLWACSAEPPREAGPVAVTLTPEPVTAAPVAEASPRASEPELSIVIPKDLACELDSSKLVRPGADLSVVAGGTPFGTLEEARTLRVFIAKGEAKSVVVEGDANGVLIRAHASAATLPVHPNRVSVFGGFLIPKHSADLHVVSAGQSGVETELSVPAEIVTTTGKTALRSTLPCSILSLTLDEFDPFETYLGVAVDDASLKKPKTPLSSSAKGEHVATLTPSEFVSSELSVLARDGKRVKIAWEVDDVIAFGWIDATAVRPRSQNGGVFGGLGLSGVGAGCCDKFVVCTKPVGLRAEVGGHTETVGRILPGTKIQILKEAPPEVDVDLPTTALARAQGARLFVDKAGLENCQEK